MRVIAYNAQGTNTRYIMLVTGALEQAADSMFPALNNNVPALKQQLSITTVPIARKMSPQEVHKDYVNCFKYVTNRAYYLHTHHD
jgi:hypothetical protein